MGIVLEWVVTSVFLTLVVLALRVLVGKHISAGLRYALWAVVLVRLLVPVQLFPSPIPASALPEISGTQAVRHRAPGTDGPNPFEGTAQTVPAIPEPGMEVVESAAASVVSKQPEPVPGFDTEAVSVMSPLTAVQILGGLWIAGAAGIALAFIVSNLRFARRLRRLRAPMEGTACSLSVYRVDGLPSPCLFGVARPAVYITAEAAVDPVMFRHVLVHEYTHYRHLDHIWNALRCAALAVHWWNPLVWIAVVLSRRDCELACDEGALKRLGDGERAAYGRTLLALITAKPRPGDLLRCATTMTGGSRSVWERVTRIARAPRRWLWAAVAVVLATALACLCAFGKAVEGPRDEADPDSTASQAGDVQGEAPAEEKTLGDMAFYSVNAQKTLTLGSAAQAFTPEHLDAAVHQYAMIDMDGDGEQEYVFRVTIGENPEVFLLILHNIEGEWYGYTVTHRGCEDVKADGTIYGSSGAGDWEFYTISAFSQTGFETTRLLWCENAYDHDEQYFVGGAPTSQQEFETAMNIQAEKELPVWHSAYAPLPDMPDLNRNGVPETITLNGIWGKSNVDVEVRENGELLWRGVVSNMHAGSCAYLLCTLEDGDYLLEYMPGGNMGKAGDRYRLFTLENGEERAVRENSVSYDYAWVGSSADVNANFDPEAVAAFVDEVNGLLSHSTLLASSVGLLQEDPLRVDITWLEHYGFDFEWVDSLTTLENLIRFKLSASAPGYVIGPNLDRDMLSERISRTVITDDELGNVGQRVELWEDETLLWADEAYLYHTGWNAVFLCKLEGKNYLLRYQPYMNQGFAEYRYELFTLARNGEERIVQENSVSFGLNFYGSEPALDVFDPGAIDAFMGEVNALLANSVQLINTDEELTGSFERSGRLYHEPLWLFSWAPDFTYNPSETLLENLQAFETAMSRVEVHLDGN